MIINDVYIWLVVTGTMEFYDFPINIGNVISSQLTKSIIFQRGRYTTNQFCLDFVSFSTFTIAVTADADDSDRACCCCTGNASSTPQLMAESMLIWGRASIIPFQQVIFTSPNYIKLLGGSSHESCWSLIFSCSCHL